MKRQSLIIFLGLSLILITGIKFFSFINYNNKTRQQLYKQITDLKDQNKYLERCLNYRLSFYRNHIKPLPGKDIIVYLSGEVCPSCVEKLLHLLYIQESIKKRTLVIVNDSSKLDFIIGYNDAFQNTFDFIFDTISFLNPVNEILILKIDSSEIKGILEFRPNEENYFKRYFNQFFL